MGTQLTGVDAVGGIEVLRNGPFIKPPAHIGDQGVIFLCRLVVGLGQLSGHLVVVPALVRQLGSAPLIGLSLIHIYLYFGNITPNDQIVKSGTALKKAMEQSAECEEKLTALLEDKEKALLLRLINAENEIGSTMALENFILGFRLGVRMILEALDEDDGSLIDPNKEG